MHFMDPLKELQGRIGLPGELPGDPFPLLAKWLEEGERAAAAPNANAMVLATASADGAPSARVVLCKAIEVETGSVVFFTNYTSLKGRDLETNPRVACVFHWDHAGRQARVVGVAARLSDAENDEYFGSRSLLSRLGAWASEQGRPLASRAELVTRLREVMRRFGVGVHHFALPQTAPRIPRPPHWGGFRIRAHMVELWLGGDGRLHDRAVWTRAALRAGSGSGKSSAPSEWTSTRLQP